MESERSARGTGRMIAAVDVDYRGEEGVAACVLFSEWTAKVPAAEQIARIPRVAPYESGKFFQRELPCILAVLDPLDEAPTTVIVDGYVWLGEEGRPGLGAYLYEALERRIPVVGVAKRLFLPARSVAIAVRRGTSRRPLYVTAAGIDAHEAARNVARMDGPFRIPTLLGWVDRLCRQALRDPPHTG
ncbi:MAG: endonuclease V [Deltaproteobacteria bacterium]|nr:MAG: endonuclease V [Deltaproteobacteria bacterium]